MNLKIFKIVASSLIIAIGLVLPIFVHMFGTGLGALISPLHLPALIGGLLLGPLYGLAIGLLIPFLSSFVNGMPMLVPFGLIMMCELGVYGLVCGYLYKLKKVNIWLALLVAMLLGRCVGGLLSSVVLSTIAQPYTFAMFISAYFINTLPAIFLQLILLPLLTKTLERVIPSEHSLYTMR